MELVTGTNITATRGLPSNEFNSLAAVAAHLCEQRDALALSVSDSNSRSCSARLSFTRRRGERPLPFRGLGSEADPCPRLICDTWPRRRMVSPLI